MKFWIYMFLVGTAFLASLGSLTVVLTRLPSMGVTSVSDWIQAILLFGVLGGAVIWTGGVLILAFRSYFGGRK